MAVQPRGEDGVSVISGDSLVGRHVGKLLSSEDIEKFQ